ncbi:MerR family transcriptional regulator [Lentilactobacillus kribbianus]|uniref:MerR family transcriptional regulator n=1 Tax=Lentilactobacillus kribbianus TaxID=2729622 RepID=UPI001556688C|nr:MerR family transcriptional regulator [Lentilactobacillus kribbianus]
MQYTIKQLSDLVGISTRTLRYYDQINLLKPATISEAGYRLYGPKQVQRLRQIMTYRALDFSLADIATILTKKPDQLTADLNQQLLHLQHQAQQLQLTIETVQQQILINQGVSQMTDQEQFEIFKQQQLAENEEQFGAEVRDKYGEATITATNQKYAQLNEEQFAAIQKTENQLIELLKATVAHPTTSAENQTTIFQLHKQWLTYTWSNYSSAAHRGLADMYLADERFTRYYDDRAGSGATQLLCNNIYAATK